MVEITAATQDTMKAEQRPGRVPLARQPLFILAICALILLDEYVFAGPSVAWGIIIALALAVGIYSLMSFLHLSKPITAAAESLALIPLYILFTSSLPWFFINQAYLTPAVYSLIIGLCLWHVYQKNLSLKQIFNIEKKNLLKYIAIGALIGIPLGTVEYLILRPAAAAPSFEFGYLLRDAVYMLFFVGLGEELLFRGFIQVDLSNAFGWKWGLFGASFIFAVMHMGWRSVPELFFVFVAGLVLGWLYLKTKNLTASIVAHGVNNVILVAVMPYVFMGLK